MGLDPVDPPATVALHQNFDATDGGFTHYGAERLMGMGCTSSGPGPAAFGSECVGDQLCRKLQHLRRQLCYHRY